MIIGLGLTLVSLLIWIILFVFWGNFWRCDQNIDQVDLKGDLKGDRSVCVVIPARNEADLLPTTLRSLLQQTHKGSVHIVLVDDQSTDGTGAVAKTIAEEEHQAHLLTVISAEPLPPGWTGKLWAMEQGIRYGQTFNPDYFLLTDADIAHDRHSLCRLAQKAQDQDLEMVSVMVLLRCQSLWETLLIPSFVFFFQKLYPFPWVNNPAQSMAAAAGGCILIKTEALERIGGIQAVRQALIDDCALAQAVKSSGSGRIWLGLTQQIHSLRPYPSLSTIWEMVARTAYTQLNYSPLLLFGTLIGMPLIYILAPLSFIAGSIIGNWPIAIAGLLTWLIMAICYFPTIRLYKVPIWLSFALPAIAFLYTLMTFDSARRHWQGQGGAWKGRVYPN